MSSKTISFDKLLDFIFFLKNFKSILSYLISPIFFNDVIKRKFVRGETNWTPAKVWLIETSFLKIVFHVFFHAMTCIFQNLAHINVMVLWNWICLFFILNGIFSFFIFLNSISWLEIYSYSISFIPWNLLKINFSVL